MMRKAEDYLKNVTAFTTREELYNIGKQMQIDAIEETVKLCVRQTQVNLHFKGLYKGAKWHKLEDGDSYNPLEDSIMAKLDKKSILNCAEILKKQLE